MWWGSSWGSLGLLKSSELVIVIPIATKHSTNVSQKKSLLACYPAKELEQQALKITQILTNLLGFSSSSSQKLIPFLFPNLHARLTPSSDSEQDKCLGRGVAVGFWRKFWEAELLVSPCAPVDVNVWRQSTLLHWPFPLAGPIAHPASTQQLLKRASSTVLAQIAERQYPERFPSCL